MLPLFHLVAGLIATPVVLNQCSYLNHAGLPLYAQALPPPTNAPQTNSQIYQIGLCFPVKSRSKTTIFRIVDRYRCVNKQM